MPKGTKPQSSPLLDFSYSYRVVMSSDKLSEMHRPVVILELDVEDGPPVRFEMDKERLRVFLAAMNK